MSKPNFDLLVPEGSKDLFPIDFPKEINCLRDCSIAQNLKSSMIFKSFLLFLSNMGLLIV